MKSITLGTTLLALGLGMSACSLTGSGPDAGAAATRVASQLAIGKFTVASFNSPDHIGTLYAGLVSGMGGLRPAVTVDHTSTEGSTATATLRWSWPVGSKPWTYTTTVALNRRGDQYLAAWSPTDVAPGLVAGGHLQLSRVPATRGNILGAGGSTLVQPRPVITVGLDKAALKPDQVASAARSLAGLAGIDPASYLKAAKAYGPQAFVPAITYRKGQQPSWVAGGSATVTGLRAIPGTLPLAPTKGFAAALLGTVGPATAQIVKQSAGRVLPGDVVGLSGLQLRYDAQLAGTPGATVAVVDDRGKARTTFTSAAVAGKPLRLTLNPRLQSLAESILSSVGPASALVAIRPSTGAVLAAASGPGSNGYDTATFGQYAPGSTFKIVTTLALLRSGLTPRSIVHCVPSLSVNGKVFTNDSEYPPSGLGDIPLTLALANSCNTGYISQHARLHGDDLGQAAAALGFGVDHDTGFPAYFGQAPAPASETEGAADMIGQGKILASPMAMADVVASVVAGHAVLPELVQGTKVAQTTPAHPLTREEATELRAMMRAVVTTPTGTGAGLADVPGPPVIAKTGTAEFGSTPPLPTHAWMVAGQGDLAVAVFVAQGHTGAGTAGPLLERFLRGS